MLKGDTNFVLEFLLLGIYNGTLSASFLKSTFRQGLNVFFQRCEHPTFLIISSPPLSFTSPLLLLFEVNCIFNLEDYSWSSQRKGWRPLLCRKVEAARLKRVAAILWKFRVLESLCIVLECLSPPDMPYMGQEWELLLSHKTLKAVPRASVPFLGL